MKSKRLLYSIFTIVLTMVLFVLPVSAQEVPENLQEVAVELREGIKNWENLITVTFEADLDSFDGTTASANDLADQVLDLALAHTGAPDEGDYLRFNIGHMEPNSVNFTKQNDGWKFSFTYYFAYWTTAQQEAELDAEIENLVQLLELKSDLTDYQKVSAIYHYICENVDYDYENLEDDTYGLKFTTYAAVVNKTAVCQGYATLFYRLALEAGVDCRVIIGYAGENHSWNAVKLDGQYYYLDSTWDSEGYDFRYFLKSVADFIDHDPDPEYETPEFLAAYPLAEKSYELPNLESAMDGDFEYRVMSGLAALLKYHGTEQHVTVPATLGGYPVYWIGGSAFYENHSIVSITFSEGIQIMESEAIAECKNLKSVHLPSTIDFTGSKVADFQCRVICGPYNCPSVETITVAEGNPNLVVVDNVLYSKDMTILRYYPSGDTQEVFEIPQGVVAIGAGAFAYNEHLKEVIMPDTVVRIQMYGFQYCSNLANVKISNNCRFIDQYNFSGTALESLHIPASLEVLYYDSIGINSRINNISIDPGNQVFYVKDNALYAHYTQKNLVVNFYQEDTHVPGDYLVKYLAGSDATSFAVPEGIIGIEQGAFVDCTNLTEIILPDSLQLIFGDAFYGCSRLAKLELPENLREIHDFAFEQCGGLVELVIPAGVKYIGVRFVAITSSLENVVFLGDAPEMTERTFEGANVNIYYPSGNTTYGFAIQLQAIHENVRWLESCASHQFASKTQEATCVLTGYTGQECSMCGLVEVTGELTPPTGHDLEFAYVGEPGCEYWGGTVYRCNICDDEITLDHLKPIGHNYDENGICKNCVANDAQISTPEYENVMLESKVMLISVCTGLGILAVIGIIVLIYKAFRKPWEK